MSDTEKSVSLEELITNELGNFGLFQLRNIILVSFAIIISAFKNDYIFTAAAIPHRCQIPECGEDGKLYNYNPEWIINAVPETRSGFSSCQRYNSLQLEFNGSLVYCPAAMFNNSQAIDCEGYVYARDNTIVYDFNLGCQEWLRVLPGTLTNVGILVGLPITGYISDRFGRRFALTYNIFNLSVFGIIKAFSVNYTMFMILQVIQTIFGGSVYSSAFIIVTELMSRKHRVLVSTIMISIFTLGQVVLGSVASQIDQWRYLTMTLYFPGLLTFTYIWLLPESVRWLLSKKKVIEAKEMLETAGRVNKKQLSESTLATLTIISQKSIPNVKNTEPSLILRVIRSSVMLKRICVTPVWWITSTLVFYGLSINSISLSDNIYSNYIITSAIEVPAYFVGFLLLDKVGRKAILSSGFIFSGLCNFIFVFTPTAHTTIRLVVYMLGKFGISMAIMTLYLYTSELYPTEYRHRLFAFCSMVGRLGSITATLTPVLMTYWYGLPSVLFGSLGFLSGLLVFTQPETLGTKLPDTMAEAEALGKSNVKLNQSC